MDPVLVRRNRLEKSGQSERRAEAESAAVMTILVRNKTMMAWSARIFLQIREKPAGAKRKLNQGKQDKTVQVCTCQSQQQMISATTQWRGRIQSRKRPVSLFCALHFFLFLLCDISFHWLNNQRLCRIYFRAFSKRAVTDSRDGHFSPAKRSAFSQKSASLDSNIDLVTEMRLLGKWRAFCFSPFQPFNLIATIEFPRCRHLRG